MDLGLLGAMLGAAKQGYDEQDYLTHKRRADDAQQARLQADDARKAQQFSDEQADRQHVLGRRPIVEQQEDDTRAAQLKGLGLRNTMEENTVDRLPIANQQNDDAFNLSQQQKKQAMDLANRHLQIYAQQVGTESAVKNVEARLGMLKLNDAQRAAQAAQDQNAVLGAFLDGEKSGDWSGLKDAYNKSAGAIHSHAIADFGQNNDGSFYAVMDNGNPVELGNRTQALTMALQMASPDVYRQSVNSQIQAGAAAAAERAKAPQKFTTLTQSPDGYLSTFDYGTRQYTPVLDNQGKPVQGTIAGKRMPDGIGFLGTFGNGNTQPTQNPNASGGSPVPPQQPTTQTSWPNAHQPMNMLNPGQPVTPPLNARQVVRTGVDPTTGQRVSQYNDGSIEYVQ